MPLPAARRARETHGPGQAWAPHPGNEAGTPRAALDWRLAPQGLGGTRPPQPAVAHCRRSLRNVGGSGGVPAGAMRLRQWARLVAAVPLVSPWMPMVVAGAAGLLLVGLGNAETGGLQFDLRVSAAAVAAATAWMLDDPAAVTLASSPTTLLSRRGARFAAAVACVAVWWSAAAAVVRVRAHQVPAAPLLREVAVLTALAVLGSIAAQRWSGDGRGGSAGAFVVAWWFALSFLPRVGAIPLPPQPTYPGAAGPLLAITALALGLAVLLSRDPAHPRVASR